VVYRKGSSALKIFKTEADFLDAEMKAAASQRLREHQKKLKAFPSLPLLGLGNPKASYSGVIVPDQLAHAGEDSNSMIVGYSMACATHVHLLTMLGRKDFQSRLHSDAVARVMSKVHRVLGSVHKSGVVIGDFNDLNILFRVNKSGAAEVYFIDADSYQYGAFKCHMFNVKFVDPLICSIWDGHLMMTQAHSKATDWYAWSVMLMQALLLTGPYGGVHRPKDGVPLKQELRPLERLSIFSDEVRAPKASRPWIGLTDYAIEHFRQTFIEDRRRVFDPGELATLKLTKCSDCGMEHYRNACPDCCGVTKVTGVVSATVAKEVEVNYLMSSRSEKVIYARYHQGCLKAVVDNDDFLKVIHFKNRCDLTFSASKLDSHSNARLRFGDGAELLAGIEGRVWSNSKGLWDRKEVAYADELQGKDITCFDTNDEWLVTIDQGNITSVKLAGCPELCSRVEIGRSLQGQSMLWVSNSSGFGLYRAGNFQVGYLFRPDRPGVNDSISRDVGNQISGQLIDAVAYFSEELVWFLTTTQEGRYRVNKCSVFDHKGKCLAFMDAKEGDDCWLGRLRGKCGAGRNHLMCATDDGIQRVTVSGDSPPEFVTFNSTARYVNGSCHLQAGDGGLYIISSNEIKHLKIRRK